MDKERVLFLCTHNSARSQMAEGFLRSMAGDRFEVASAGTEATRVHPLAIRAMAEVGVDLGGHTSKTVERGRAPRGVPQGARLHPRATRRLARRPGG
jgi:arsenate reductase